MAKKGQPSAEKKFEAVMALVRRDEPATVIARRYEISETSLYRWRDEFVEGGKAALKNKRAVSESQQLRELKKEIEERDRVIGEITIANRIFKKFRTACCERRIARRRRRRAQRGGWVAACGGAGLARYCNFELVPQGKES